MYDIQFMFLNWDVLCVRWWNIVYRVESVGKIVCTYVCDVALMDCTVCQLLLPLHPFQVSRWSQYLNHQDFLLKGWPKYGEPDVDLPLFVLLPLSLSHSHTHTHTHSHSHKTLIYTIKVILYVQTSCVWFTVYSGRYQKQKHKLFVSRAFQEKIMTMLAVPNIKTTSEIPQIHLYMHSLLVLTIIGAPLIVIVMGASTLRSSARPCLWLTRPSKVACRDPAYTALSLPQPWVTYVCTCMCCMLVR